MFDGTTSVSDPAQLHDRHADRIPQCRCPPRRVRCGCPQPLGDQGQSHDDVSDDDDQVVAVVEQPGDPGGHHQRPSDLHQHRQPVGHVVVVIGRGEPGEVHPGPPDGEEHHQVADNAGADMVLDERVIQVGGPLGDRDNETQVEQQFQRSGDPVVFVGSPGPHRDIPGPGDGVLGHQADPSRPSLRGPG